MSIPEAIFIIGTGRSGTHFALRCLKDFARTDDFLDGSEDGAVLRKIAVAAMRGAPLPPAALIYYTNQAAKAAKADRVLLDQHHPNLWHVKQLIGRFPQAVFVYPDRPVVQVVASMLLHKGVSDWYDQLRSGQLKISYPSAFFGLSSPDELASLSPHRLAARRVLAHRQHAQALAAEMPDKVRFISYERLVQDPGAELARVFSTEELQTLGDFVPKEAGDSASLAKFREQFSEAEIAEIADEEANWSRISASLGEVGHTAIAAPPVKRPRRTPQLKSPRKSTPTRRGQNRARSRSKTSVAPS